MNKVWMIVGLALTTLWITGCCCGNMQESFDSYQEKAAEAGEAVESASTPAAANSSSVGGACGDYSKCCKDYADALSTLSNYPKESVDAQKDACDSVESLAGLPGGDDACKTSLDALKTGMDGMSAYPGWKTPASCK